MQRLEKLMELLKNNQKYNVTYKKGFSNHLSMTLIALYFLDADDHQLQTTFNEYIPHLENIEHTDFEITGINWKKHLGTGEHYWSYYKFFRAKKSTLGIEEVLRCYLAHLIKGVVGGLFHPLIRLSYALDFWNYASSQDNQQLNSIAEEEAIIALAYLADSYIELPVYGDQNKKLSVLLGQLQNEKNFPSKLTSIIELIKNVAEKNDAYKAYSNNIYVCADDFNIFANEISQIYLKYQDFTLLHFMHFAESVIFYQKMKLLNIIGTLLWLLIYR